MDNFFSVNVLIPYLSTVFYPVRAQGRALPGPNDQRIRDGVQPVVYCAISSRGKRRRSCLSLHSHEALLYCFLRLCALCFVLSSYALLLLLLLLLHLLLSPTARFSASPLFFLFIPCFLLLCITNWCKLLGVHGRP